MDVAHLVAFLGRSEERSQRKTGEAEPAANVFLDEYFTVMPKDWQSRICHYHAMTSVYKAVGLSRKSGRERQDPAAIVLREGLARLTDNVGGRRAPSYKRRLTKIASS